MLNVDELPYLTADAPGVGGRIKERPDDFVVEEVPLYEPCGEGTHVYLRIEKRGIPTLQAVREIARALGRRTHDIGYAGLKDADAVTTQMLSVEHVEPERIAALEFPRIRVSNVSRHRNKLKLGHLAGNRFEIKLRGVDPRRADVAQSVMDALSQRGAPNYFGRQRFGQRGDTWAIGRALLHNDHPEAMAIMLGRPGPLDSGDIRKARRLFDEGDFHGAAAAWPFPFQEERRACRALARAKSNARRALGAVDKSVRRLFVSAYQSYLFNQVVARRLPDLDRLMLGDLAWRHDNGAVFRVEDAGIEQPRCDAFEISPTGPIFGHRMTAPTGAPGAMEQAVLQEEGVTLDAWGEGPRRVKGGRRPLRFRPYEPAVDAGTDDAGTYIRLRFTLDPGCYATTILREICKTGAEAEDADGADSDEKQGEPRA